MFGQVFENLILRGLDIVQREGILWCGSFLFLLGFLQISCIFLLLLHYLVQRQSLLLLFLSGFAFRLLLFFSNKGWEVEIWLLSFVLFSWLGLLFGLLFGGSLLDLLYFLRRVLLNRRRLLWWFLLFRLLLFGFFLLLLSR